MNRKGWNWCKRCKRHFWFPRKGNHVGCHEWERLEGKTPGE